jgi:hypothetical protein
VPQSPRILDAMSEIELIFGDKLEKAKDKGKLANVLCTLVLDAQHDTKVAEDICHTAAVIDGMGWLDNPERIRKS